MDKPITRFERVLLFPCTTSIRLAKDIPSMFGQQTEFFYKNNSFVPPCIILFALLDLISHHFNLNISISCVAVLVYIIFDIIIKLFYADKIDTITNNYSLYYSGYLYAIFILLAIGGFVYIFNSLIGGSPKST